MSLPKHTTTEAGYRPVHERITDFSQVEQTLSSHERKLQASLHGLRCTLLSLGMPVGQ